MYSAAKSKILHLGLALSALVTTGGFVKQQLLTFQGRTGYVLNDPVLKSLGPWELSPIIFILTYAPIGFCLFTLLKRCTRLVRFIYAYSLLQLMRIVCIYWVPLDPPEGMLTLKDPISDTLVFGDVITKDLFFSGHVSAVILCSFYFKSQKTRWVYRCLALVNATCLMGQHVHYSIDVLAAPFFAWLSFYALDAVAFKSGGFFSKLFSKGQNRRPCENLSDERQ
jgi:hypothetical protein